jgi:predicted RNase H-like HicB family nuclease
VDEAAYRAALARQVRDDAAERNPTTFLVEVEEHGGFWTLSVPQIPGVRARADSRQEITPAATAAIAAALEVPRHFFELHFRFRG